MNTNLIWILNIAHVKVIFKYRSGPVNVEQLLTSKFYVLQSAYCMYYCLCTVCTKVCVLYMYYCLRTVCTTVCVLYVLHIYLLPPPRPPLRRRCGPPPDTAGRRRPPSPWPPPAPPQWSWSYGGEGHQTPSAAANQRYAAYQPSCLNSEILKYVQK